MKQKKRRSPSLSFGSGGENSPNANKKSRKHMRTEHETSSTTGASSSTKPAKNDQSSPHRHHKPSSDSRRSLPKSYSSHRSPEHDRSSHSPRPQHMGGGNSVVLYQGPKRNSSPHHSTRHRESHGRDGRGERRRKSLTPDKPRREQREMRPADSRRHRHGYRETGDPGRVKEEPVSDDETQRRSRQENDRRRIEKRRREDTNPFESQEKFDWGKKEPKEEEEGEQDRPPKEKPNFETSGKLAADTNTFNGVVVKYNEPPEARKPKLRWRLYPFKGDETLPVLYIHRQSAYLIGRDRRVVDIPVDHPSCSKQHAAIQYRVAKYERDDGSLGRRIKPYIIDLGSANGTFINNKTIQPQRYTELKEKDVLKFGFSSREYVVLHENSQDSSGESDDEKDE